jgi:hypothetical protein
MAYLSGGMPRHLFAFLAALLATIAACSEHREGGGGHGIFGAGHVEHPKDFDPSRPQDGLALGADEAASRLGSFVYSAEVSYNVVRQGSPPVHTSEHHRLRQLAGGDFEVDEDLDPTADPGSETGKQIVFTRGVTYVRERYAPYRVRSSDRGVEARRERDESFRLASDLALLYGPALALTPAGETTTLGRPALRYRLSLSGNLPEPAPAPPLLPGGAYDPDTERRIDFLEGRVPVALEGEVALDRATGVPLSVSLKGAFSEKKDPQLRVELSLTSAVTALGAQVEAVVAPSDALPDEERPRGVARALEAAGLRKPAGTKEQENEEEGDEAQTPP